VKPESRPISFTSPTPLRAATASAFAASIALRASLTAVSNPNVFCTNDTSLSMVFGMPTTPIVSPCRDASSLIFCAARSVPSPPIVNSTPTPSALRVSTICAGS
jgi:hypothetical protein